MKKLTKLLFNPIDEQGRDIINMHTNAARPLETARTLSQIGLGVTVRQAYDTSREQMSVMIIEWILDLTRSRLGAGAHTLHGVIANQLLAPRKPSTLNPNPEAQKALSEVESPVRLDYHPVSHPIVEAAKTESQGDVREPSELGP